MRDEFAAQEAAPPAHEDRGIADRAAALLYYEADVAFRRRVMTILRFIEPRPSERILDAGCGLGFYLHLLARLTRADVWGIELDAERLAATSADPYASRTRRLQGDVTRLPFAAASFDKAISSEVLEHLPDDAAAVAELARVLKPGGVCAVTVPNANYPFLWDPINYLREAAGLGHFSAGPLTGIWTDHRRLYSADQIVALLTNAGLRVTDVRLETRFAFPFSHNLIYVVGKHLVDSRALGATTARRSALWTDERRWTVARAAARLFALVDRLNQDHYAAGPTVSICVRAIKRRAGR